MNFSGMRLLGGLLLALALVISLWVGVYEIFTKSHPTLADRGLAGDSFGGVNSLFSALAFSALVVTLLLQFFQLRAQLRELVEAREAQQETANALREQLNRMQRDSLMQGLIVDANLTLEISRLKSKDLTDLNVADRGVTIKHLEELRGKISEYSEKSQSEMS